jgi:hypothetical protein
MDLLLRNKLRILSDDEFVSTLYHQSDSLGFLQPHHMSKFGVVVAVPLTVSEFLDFLSFTLLEK